MTKPKPKPDDPEQFARFKNAAKEAGLDETGEALDRAMSKIVPPRVPASMSDDEAWKRAERGMPRNWRDKD